jgi:hypothetical protein
MDLSRPPQIGAVISFCYLWRREFEAGLVEGTKARPCLVVAIEPERGEGGVRPWVTVLPLTHRPPADPATVMALPADTKRRLGLDDEASWIVLGEANGFLWPGYDIRPLAGGDAWLYGYVGRGLFITLRRKLADLLRNPPSIPAIDRGG